MRTYRVNTTEGLIIATHYVVTDHEGGLLVWFPIQDGDAKRRAVATALDTGNRVGVRRWVEAGNGDGYWGRTFWAYDYTDADESLGNMGAGFECEICGAVYTLYGNGPSPSDSCPNNPHAVYAGTTTD